VTQPGYINQIICTIQGEGNCIGQPVILIRFNGCNLNCLFCDSKYTWNRHINPKSFPDIKTDIDTILAKYPNINNLMITGGEPFHQPELLEFIIDTYPLYDIQIETNGFNIHELDIIKKISLYNIRLVISPKLQLNNYPNNITSYDLINSFENLYISLVDHKIKHIFKLVYCKELEQKILTVYHMLTLFKLYTDSTFWIMPLTPHYQDINFNNKYKQSCFDAINFCKEYGFNYSPRIHVDLFKFDNSETCNNKGDNNGK